MKIAVKMPTGQTIALDVEPFDTIVSLKDKLQSTILPYRHLIFEAPYSTLHLEDNRTLASYGINEKSELLFYTDRSL